MEGRPKTITRSRRRKRVAIAKFFVLYTNAKKHTFIDHNLGTVMFRRLFVKWCCKAIQHEDLSVEFQQLFHTKEFKDALQNENTTIGATRCNFLQLDISWYDFCYACKGNFCFFTKNYINIQIQKHKLDFFLLLM